MRISLGERPEADVTVVIQLGETPAESLLLRWDRTEGSRRQLQKPSGRPASVEKIRV